MTAAALAAALAVHALAASPSRGAPRLPDVGASLRAAAGPTLRPEQAARAGLELQNALNGEQSIPSPAEPVAAGASTTEKERLAPFAPVDAAAAAEVPNPSVAPPAAPQRRRFSAAFDALVVVAFVAASLAAGYAAYDSFSEIARIGESQLRGSVDPDY